MRKLWKVDFGKPVRSETWYSPDYDQVLIEQSIAKQYGVLPSEQENLRYTDWAKMVGGLMDDTPLGRVVAIRAETDREVIRRMTADQRKIRSEWAAYRASVTAQNDQRQQMKQLQAMIAGMFGRG